MNIFTKMVGRCLTQFPIFVFSHGKHVVSKLLYVMQLVVPTTCCITCTVCSSAEQGLRLWAPSPFIYRLASLDTQHSSLCVCTCQRVASWLEFVVVQVLVQIKLCVWFSLFLLYYFYGFTVRGQDFTEPGWRQKAEQLWKVYLGTNILTFHKEGRLQTVRCF